MTPQIGPSVWYQSAAILLIGSHLMLALTIGVVHSMPYNTDCMKNPFASGCRGISAKRSSGSSQPWNNNPETDQLARGLALQAGGSRAASLYELIASDHRANQLSVAIDLVADAVHQLARWQAQEPLTQVGLRAMKRALGKKSQREEAS